MKRSAWWYVLVVGATACSGSIEDGGSAPAGASPNAGDNVGPNAEVLPPASAGQCGESSLPPARVWRLTNAQYENTLRELLPGAEIQDLGLEVEPVIDAFSNNASSLSVSTRLAGQLQKAAGQLAIEGQDQFATYSGCTQDAFADEGCVQNFIAAFGQRAFRRPLTAEEIAGYLAVYHAGLADDDAAAGVRLVVQTLLQSPHTLYRTELGHPEAAADGIVRLTNYELASALSYSLWSSAPDEALYAAAAAGTLAQDAEIEAQARRMLVDPRARGLARQFVQQWLAVKDPVALVRNEEEFPGFESVKADMHEEFKLLAESAFFGTDSNLGSVFHQSSSFLTRDLADFYGLSGGGATGPGEVSLIDVPRVGLLTSGALVASWSGTTNTTPMTRGRLFIERVLCQQMPPPPPSIDVPPPIEDETLTTRQRFAIHGSDPSCSGCHSKLDAVAFALEHFDSAGHYRTTEAQQPIDASGAISDTLDADGPFQSIEDLALRLSMSRHARACLATQYVRFASGLGHAGDSDCLTEQLIKASATAGDTPIEMIVAWVKSEPFRTRRIE